MKITKRWLKLEDACLEGIEWVVENCKDGEAVDVINTLIEDNKFDWANWLIVRVMMRPQYLQYAIFAAEQVIEIFEKKYTDDKRPREAIEAAKLVLKNDNHAAGAAWDAARAAAGDAWAAGDAARAAGAAARAAGDAAWAAGAAGDAAWAAGAAWDAAWDAAWAAGAAARAAGAAAGAAARAAGDAGDAAKQKMQIKILRYGLKLLKEKTQCLGRNAG